MAQLIFDGQTLKSVPLESLPESAWTTHGDTDDTDLEKTAASVAFLNRAIEIRANSLVGMPWEITPVADDAEAVWTSEDEDAPPQLSFLSNLPMLLWQTEASWCLKSQAFWHRERNRARTLNVRWLDPNSMTPQWDATAGLVSFERALANGQKKTFTPDDIVYIWRQGLRETTPAIPPAQAAAQAAGVLYNADAFAAGFFARGAIKATLLTVDGNPSAAEMQKLEAWWKRFFSGIAGAWQTAAVRMGVTPVTIGEGLESLTNETLTNAKREDIATAIGVPPSMVMANAANYATAQQDEKNYYNLTIIPDSRLIQRQINRQLLAPMGLRLTFKPQELPCFQEDENTRSVAFKNYVDAGISLAVAAEMLGLYLPGGMQYADLEPDDPEPVAPVVVMAPQAPAPAVEPDAGDEAAAIEAGQFKRWLKKKPGRDASKFQHTYLTAEDTAQIIAEANKARIRATRDHAAAIEAALKKRAALEKQATVNIWEGFKAAYSDLQENANMIAFERMLQDDEALALLAHANQLTRDAIARAILEGADLGVTVAVDQLGPLGFDWTLVNTSARDWAMQHSAELIKGIEDTTQAGIRGSVARWIENGEPLEALIQDLEMYYARDRAELIAITEVTNAFAEANMIAYQQSGVCQGSTWHTGNDEKVCKICGPLNGQKRKFGEEFAPGILKPAAHPRCRCTVSGWLS